MSSVKKPQATGEVKFSATSAAISSAMTVAPRAISSVGTGRRERPRVWIPRRR